MTDLRADPCYVQVDVVQRRLEVAFCDRPPPYSEHVRKRLRICFPFSSVIGKLLRETKGIGWRVERTGANKQRTQRIEAATTGKRRSKSLRFTFPTGSSVCRLTARRRLFMVALFASAFSLKASGEIAGASYCKATRTGTSPRPDLRASERFADDGAKRARWIVRSHGMSRRGDVVSMSPTSTGAQVCIDLAPDLSR